MSNIRVNITELLQVLECTPPEHNLMLVGNHGIGKSEILTQYFAERGMRVVALFLGQMADLIKMRKRVRRTLCHHIGFL